VIDERGKYIYISPSEMASVAKFIKFRGRVSIEEIAQVLFALACFPLMTTSLSYFKESNKLVVVAPSKPRTQA